MTVYAASPAGSVRVVPLRFVDGDTVRGPQGEVWHRGLRSPGAWEQFPLSEQSALRSDDQMRALLEEGEPGWTFVPHLPPITAPLPGTACVAVREVRDLWLVPASGAALYAARLGRTQSFLGNDRGVFTGGSPVRLRLADLRATLEGVLARRPSAKVTYHRLAGRAYARYATGSTLHTHVLLLTR
ncbi:hypothetical protein [Streptomyces murinus]|uniref:hypothetical protein n=1 Tax=Streptomyces murinus TaxID=33900 RepID=UPI003814FA67